MEAVQRVVLALDRDRVGVVSLRTRLPLAFDSVAIVAAQDVKQGLVRDGELLLLQGHIGRTEGHVDR